MRKLKLIVLMLSFQLSIYSQSYIPLPNTNAIWTISTLAQGATKGLYKYGMYGDTIINNVTYKKIYENFDYNFNISNSIYRGAIREFAKKVYKVNPWTNTEGLLYDFNLNVGDTARSITPYGNIYKQKVIGINYITYNGVIHKKWLFQTGEYWLEGIGSSFSLLYTLLVPNDFCQSLICLSVDGIIQYENTNPECTTPLPYDCEGVLNPVPVNEHSIETNKNIIFPNPFSNSAVLKTSIELNDATLKVFDILGQEVLVKNHLNGNEININKGCLNNGNYYYHITQNGNLISKGKFIIE